jgi:hypothetical protein
MAPLLGVMALTAGLFLQWSAAFYLPMLLCLGIPMAALVAGAVACGGLSMAGWLMLVVWGAASVTVGPAEAVFVVLWGVPGLVLALAIRDQWWHGWAIAAVAAALLASAGLHLLLHEEEFGRGAQGLFSYLVVSVQQHALTQSDAEVKQKLNVLSELGRTTQMHWASIGPGIGAVLIVLATAVTAQLAAVGVRTFAERPAFKGSFGELRVPESLVWLGILLALLAFADWRWDVPALRLISWNGGIGLSALYFLNGLAVFLGVLGMAGNRVLAPLALVLVCITFGQAYPALGFVGLFDTWGEFRGRLSRLLARMRKRSEEDNDV